MPHSSVYNRAAAAPGRGRLDECEHVIALREGAPHAAFEHARALAVDHAHASRAAAARFGDERVDGVGGLRLGEAMQVRFVLDLPVHAPQLAQDVRGMARAQVGTVVFFSRLAPSAVLAPHPSVSRYLSASSAAMQPVPALVTACR